MWSIDIYIVTVCYCSPLTHVVNAEMPIFWNEIVFAVLLLNNKHKVFTRHGEKMICLCAFPGDLFSQLMRTDPSTIKGAEALMLGEMLTLPQNFG